MSAIWCKADDRAFRRPLPHYGPSRQPRRATESVKGFGCRPVVTYPPVLRPAFFNRAAFGKSKFLSSAWGPFLRPGLRIEVRRAQGRSRLAAGHRRRRRGLDGREHGATLDQTGIYATSCRGHGSFRGLPCCRSAATWHRGGWHRYVRNAINFREECRNAGRAIAKPRPGWDAVPPCEAKLGSFCGLIGR